MKKPFEEELLELIQPLENEYEAYEAFRGLLTLALHIWMANFSTAEKPPFEAVEEIFFEAFKNYQYKTDLNFGPSPTHHHFVPLPNNINKNITSLSEETND